MPQSTVIYWMLRSGRLSTVRADGRWIAIANDLLTDIRDGRLKVGDRVPSITDLCARFGVARQTAQKAVGHLRALGVVTSRPSSGTWVAALPGPMDEEIQPPVARVMLETLAEHDERLVAVEDALRRMGALPPESE